MKKLLLKIAHSILKRYGIVPLDMKDKILYNGAIFEIQNCVMSREFFKTDLEIKASDCLKWIDQKDNPMETVKC